MNNKIVYVITTYKCSACKCIECILKDIQKNNPTFTITTFDFHDTPDWLKNNVIITDFPTIIFTKDDTIKYHFTGTKSKKNIEKIIQDIEY